MTELAQATAATPMREAFGRAGWVLPATLLRDAVADALATSGGDVEAAARALRDAMKDNPAIALEMARREIGRALDEARNEITSDQGQTSGDARWMNAPTDVGAGGHCSIDAQSPIAARSKPRPRSTRGITAAAVVVARSILDSHRTELGKPVGDCSRAELVALASRSRRYAVFYDALAHEMPIGTNETARAFVRHEQADGLWRRALEEQR